MKNSVLFIFVLLLIACNKNKEPGDADKLSSTGNSFTLKGSFFDGLIRKDSFYVDNNQNTIFYNTEYRFNLVIEYFILENFKLQHSSILPFLEYYYAYSPNSGFDLFKDDSMEVVLEQKLFSPKADDYEHLIVIDPDSDLDVIYSASTGFFLQQYVDIVQEENTGSQVKLGFYNKSNNSMDIKVDDLMTVFYEKTANSAKNDPPPFQSLNPQQLLDQVQIGISNLINSNSTNKHLTILTYSLFDKSLVDSAEVKEIHDLILDEEITLNIISLLPVDFLQHIVFKSNGFMHSDITYIDNISNFIANPSEYTSISEGGVFPSSAVIQNMEKFLSGSTINYNRYSIPSIYTNYANISTDSAKRIILDQVFHITWLHSKSYFPREFELKPILN